MLNFSSLTRYWKSEISFNGLILTLSHPLTVEFNIRKNITGQLNQATFSIYNLNSTTRQQIEFDRFLTQNAQSINSGIATVEPLYVPVSFYSGFNMLSMANLFQGNIQQAYSTKNKVDVKTIISCVDGLYGFNNSFSKIDVKTDTNSSNVLSSVLYDLKNLGVGYVTDVVKYGLPYGMSYNGRTIDKLRSLSNGNANDSKTFADFFIDNEKVNILGTYEAFVNKSVTQITGSTMLDAPRRSGQYIELSLIFEPSFQLGQIVNILTSYNSFMSGQYKVVGINHSGVLGGSKSGQCQTTLQLFNPNNVPLIPISR